MMLMSHILFENDIPTTKLALNWLVQNGIPATVITRSSSRLSKTQHLRIKMAEPQILAILQKAGAQVSDQNVPDLSGKYKSLAATFPEDFEEPGLAGKTIYFTSTFKQTGADSQARVASKQLIPTKLGLEGKEFSKESLVSTLTKTIPTLSVDDTLKKFLLQLVGVAAGKRQQVDPDINEEIDSGTRGIVGIDFGEILAPIMMTDGSETIVFPTGNAMLADVEINGTPISIKSATGSGTSFRAINKIMDEFRDQVKKGKERLSTEEEEIHRFFRAFVDTKGNNKDKIIAGAHAANTEETQAMAKLVGKRNFSFQDLVQFADQFDDYGDFLKAVYPISTAGNRGKPVGMPADHKYYMKMVDVAPKKKQAGKPSWDANGAVAGADIMVYILGTSFLADAKTEDKKTKFTNLLKRILAKVDATLMHINITPDGKIAVKKKPFSQMDYNFQYHAPSHIPGNNLPGFTLVLD